MKFNLKKFLKNIKLNEETISMVLGAIVVVIVGILIVNYFKDKGGNGSITENSSQTINIVETHTVVKGETLWSIAEDSFGSGYNWVDIKAENKLSTEIVEVGQKLVIPEVSPKKPTSTKVTATISSEQTISGSSYTIEKGDTLWDIAVRAYGDGYKWTQIASENKLVNPNLIYPGNVLTLSR